MKEELESKLPQKNSTTEICLLDQITENLNSAVNKYGNLCVDIEEKLDKISYCHKDYRTTLDIENEDVTFSNQLLILINRLELANEKLRAQLIHLQTLV